MKETYICEILKVLKSLKNSQSEFEQALILLREAIKGRTFLIDISYLNLKAKNLIWKEDHKKTRDLIMLRELCHGLKGCRHFLNALNLASYNALYKILDYLSQPRLGGEILASIDMKRVETSMNLVQLLVYIGEIILNMVGFREVRNLALVTEATKPRHLLRKIPRMPGKSFYRVKISFYNLTGDLLSNLLSGVRHVSITLGDLKLEYGEERGLICLRVNAKSEILPSKEIEEVCYFDFDDLEMVFQDLERFADQAYDSLNHNCQHFVSILLKGLGSFGIKLMKKCSFFSFPLLAEAPIFKTHDVALKDKNISLEDETLEYVEDYIEEKASLSFYQASLSYQRKENTRAAFEGTLGKFDCNIDYIKNFPVLHYVLKEEDSMMGNTSRHWNWEYKLDLSKEQQAKIDAEWYSLNVCSKEEKLIEEVTLEDLSFLYKFSTKKKSKSFLRCMKEFSEESLRLAFEYLEEMIPHISFDFFLVETYVRKLEKYLQFISLRKNKKTVWAPFFEFFRLKLTKYQEDHSPIFAEHTEVKLFEDPVENIKTQVKELAEYFKVGEYLEWGAYRRIIRKNPLTDLRLEEAERNLRKHFDFPKGVGSNQFSDSYHIWASTNRYFKKNHDAKLSTETIDEVADAMLEAFPGSFADAKLVSYYKVMKAVNRKFSSSFPFFCDRETKTKAQLFKKLTKCSINDYLVMQAKRGFIYEHIHHVFPKISVLNLEKIVAKPESFRTIIAQYFVGYAHMMTFSYDVNKRDHYQFLPAQIRLPMSGGYLSMLAKKHGSYKHTFATDMSKWDSSLPDQIIDIVRRVRQLGFKNHYNYKQIASFIEANYEALKKGALFDVLGGKVWRMLCGETTGHANTTMDNSISLIAAFLIAWKELTGLPMLDFFKYNLLSCYGDDNIFSTNLVTEAWNPKSLCAFLSKKLGIEMRVENEGKVTDVTFLAKGFVKGEVYLEEFIKAGIKVPEYAVVHQADRLNMNFSTLKMKKNTPIWLYQRAMGYLLNTAHHKLIYDEIVSYMEDQKVGIRRHNGGSKFLKKFPIMSYEEVLRITYMTKNERLENIQKPYQWTLEDSLRYSYNKIGYLEYFVDTTIQQVRGVASFCRDNGLSSCEIELFGMTKAKQYCEGFEVESFVYLKNGSPDDFSTFNRLMMESPWFIISRPSEFWSQHKHILKESDIDYYSNRVIMLSILYIIVHRGINFLSSMPILGIAARLFKLHSFEAPHIYTNLNYMHWLTKGNSSLTLSSIIPKDAWKNHKEAAVWCLNRIKYTLPLPIEVLSQKPKVLIELFISLYTIKWKAENFLINTFINVRDWNVDLNFKNQWLDHQEAILQLLTDNINLQIKSVTGSGKTSCLPRVLANHYDTIYLLFPRRCLVEQVNLPSCDKVHGKMQNPLTGAKFVATTYGWFEANRPNIGPRDLLFFDEFHEKDLSMIPLITDYELNHKIFSSATPIKEVKCASYDTKMERRHEIETIEISLNNSNSLPQIFVDAIKNHVGQSGLFIYPDMRFNSKLVKSLKVAFPSEEFSLFDSDHRKVPVSGHIIATSIVDSGMDIQHISFVVDSNVERITKNGKSALRISRDNTVEQRRGRVGRHSKGYYYKIKGVSNLSPSDPDIDAIRYCNHYLLYKDWFGLKPVHFKVSSYYDTLPNVTDFSQFNDDVIPSYKQMLELWYQLGGQKLKIKKYYNKLRRGEDYEYFEGNKALWSYEQIVTFMNENPMIELSTGKLFHVVKVIENELVLNEIEF